MSTHVQWLAPPPLWEELRLGSDPSTFRRPSILRFATDTFMQDLQKVLQTSPQTLKDYVAQGETWRNPAVGLDTAGPATALKLYQPSQARFYLVASSLTCRVPGLPDHSINRNAGESVAFVVRQLRPNSGYSPASGTAPDPAQCTEYAWIPGTASVKMPLSSTTSGKQNPSGTQPGWMQASGSDLVAGEEQIPLSFTQTGSKGASRKIFIGLIPASRRQQYIGGTTLPANSGNTSTTVTASSSGTQTDSRADLFNRLVVAPWCNLVTWLRNPGSQSSGQSVSNDDISKFSSALILLDFSTFLSQNIPNVWGAVGDSSRISSLSSTEATLYSALGSDLRKAILEAGKCGSQLEQIGPSIKLPSGYTPYALTDSPINPATLQTPIANALPPLGTVSTPVAVLPPNAQQPSDASGSFWFIVRCIYMRPKCLCNVISPPCEPFQLASYFDSDAPARRIQMAMPIDTSVAALRKYDKGVAILFSQELRNQMSRVASLSDLSNGNIGSGSGLNIGFICSLSIPIITICAMILLFVIVIALNLVFFWLPFFKICFPVPGLKGNN